MLEGFNKKIAVIGFALILTACGTTRWGHSINSENDFNRDRAQCNMIANSSVPNNAIALDPRMTPIQQANAASYNAGANFGRALNIQTAYENCMFSKGYFKDRR